MRLMTIALMITLAAMLTACGKENPSSGQRPDQQRARTKPVASSSASVKQDGAPLPPPGHPLVGHKPPMPAPVDVESPPYDVKTWVSDLEIPWDIAFPSAQRAYVTERHGRVRLVENGRLVSKPYAVIKTVQSGEGGLLGIVLHPRYPDPRYVYLMHSYESGGGVYNKVSRFTDTGSGLANELVLVRGIAGGFIHNGGALRFGPDGMLYVGTGEAGHPERAQDRSSLDGKILRMTPDGGVPKDNPFPGSLVYAYGFRNVQGLAWNPANGDLWATNHGPTGEFGLYAKDSVFIVRKGGNYGWPRTLGVTEVSSVVPPVLWFPGPSVPPGLCTFYDSSLMPELKGNFFFASLRGEHLARVVFSGHSDIKRLERWFENGLGNGSYGRLRAVAVGPDGALYVSTSNRDGRGPVNPGDDRILRIGPRARA